jgi:hypothetical protein
LRRSSYDRLETRSTGAVVSRRRWRASSTTGQPLRWLRRSFYDRLETKSTCCGGFETALACLLNHRQVPGAVVSRRRWRASSTTGNLSLRWLRRSFYDRLETTASARAG